MMSGRSMWTLHVYFWNLVFVLFRFDFSVFCWFLFLFLFFLLIIVCHNITTDFSLKITILNVNTNRLMDEWNIYMGTACL